MYVWVRGASGQAPLQSPGNPHGQWFVGCLPDFKRLLAEGGHWEIDGNFRVAPGSGAIFSQTKGRFHENHGLLYID